MTPLPPFPLPLPTQPPDGYGREECALSILSTTTAFEVSIRERDRFLGRMRCVICGIAGSTLLQHCHIIGQAEPRTVSFIPPETKEGPQHEPRNGLLMCNFHHAPFDKFHFFIRFVPDTQRFIFVNYSGSDELQRYHGKAIGLDNQDRHAPFPSLFVIHEIRVRGFHPFQPISSEVPDGNPFQDWIVADGVFDDISRSQRQHLSQFPHVATNSGPGVHTLELNANIINEILAATHAMPSWKACVVEGTSWDGTANENIEKYISSIGVDKSA
ncbi:hypothetical protein EDB92DRAFT_1934172 [Lactarius akahatsu]|uniref:HNH nuclease domain-containing protein n=1 Tax=Lactarius akahatsu TaxID=416441 RepID=A0AAD4LJ21_9AGAM|nr:hypothetical protein EDB92DRAFT_1934172 [Lactarius akahatsu]